MVQKIYDKLFRHISPEKEWEIWHRRTLEKITEAKTSGRIFELSNSTEVKYYKWIANELFQLAGPIQGSTLEVGGGSGALSLELSKRYGCKTTILDLSEIALEYAKMIFGKHDCAFIIGDATEAPLVNETFNLVHSVGLIEHFPDSVIQKMINEMYRLTRKGGYVFIAVPNYFSPDLISLWLKYGKGSERYISVRRLVSLASRSGLLVKNYGHSEFAFPKRVNRFVPETVEKFFGKNGIGFLNYVVCKK